ncbi:FUSC family protein [bacterium]|nr:MAG: FUSC family protein [bacterium]
MSMARLKSWRSSAQRTFAFRESQLTLWHSVAFSINIGAPLLFGWLHYDARLGPLGGILGLLLSLADRALPLPKRLVLLLQAAVAVFVFGIIGANLPKDSVPFWILLVGSTFIVGWYSLVGSSAASSWRYGALALASAAATPSLGVSAIILLAFATGVCATTRYIGHIYFNDDTPVLPTPAVRERPRLWISLRYCGAFSAAVAVGLALGNWQGAHRPLWIATTVLLVMQPDPQLSFQRIAQRLLGTCVGVGMAAIIVSTLHSEILLASAAIGIALILPHGSTRNYWIHSAFSAGLVLVLIDFALSGHSFDGKLLTERIRDVALGSAIVLAATIFSFPPSFRKIQKEEVLT